MLYRFKPGEQALIDELDNWCTFYLPRQFAKQNKIHNQRNQRNQHNQRDQDRSKWFRLFVYRNIYLAVDNRSTESEFWQSELRQFVAMTGMTGLTNLDANQPIGKTSQYNRKVLAFTQAINLDVDAIIRKASSNTDGSAVFFSDNHIVVTALDKLAMLRIALPIQTALDEKPDKLAKPAKPAKPAKQAKPTRSAKSN